MLKQTVCVVLSASVLITSPGLGAVEALAQSLPTASLPDAAGLPSAQLPAAEAPGLDAAPAFDAPSLGAAPLGAASDWEKLPVDVRLDPKRTQELTGEQRFDAMKIAEMMQGRLFTWKRAALRTPGTVFDGAKGPIVDLGEIFQAPTADEVARLALPRRGFDAEQLSDIRRTASFKVASKDYPGQSHEWKLGRLLQKGSDAIRETFRGYMANGAEQLVVGIPNRFVGEKLSCREAGRNGVDGVVNTVGLLIGLPETRSRFGRPDAELAKAAAEFVAAEAKATPFDAGMYLPQVVEKAAPIVQKLDANTQKAFESERPALSEKITEQLKKEGLSGAELAQKRQDRLQSELQARVYAAYHSSKELQALRPGLGQALVHRGQALDIVSAWRAAAAQTRQAFLASLQAELTQKNPIRSRIHAWLASRLNEAGSTYDRVRGPVVDKLIVTRLAMADLKDQAFFLDKELEFAKDKAPRLRARLEADRVPNRVFQWNRRIWHKANWKIAYVQPQGEGQKGYYTIEKYETTKVTTYAPFWRVANAFVRWLVWANNGAYHLLISNTINGPLGLRSLFGNKEFSSGWTVDQKTGKLVPDRDMTGTLASRIRSLWASRRQILEEHEKKNNYGLFGKGVERAVLFFTADLARGVIAPAILAVAQPVLTAANVSVSLTLGATAGVWGAAASAAAWAFNALVYDTEGTNYGSSRRGLWRLLPAVHEAFRLAIGGVLQAVAAAGAILVVHPAIAAANYAWGGVRTGARIAYDAFIYAVIKKWGRVPGRDARFMVTRVAGPGLSSEYFFQISPDVALVALQASLEKARLAQFRGEVEAKIAQPAAAYGSFLASVGAVLDHPFGPSRNAPGFSRISADAAAAEKELNDALSPRERIYARLLELGERGRIKLPAAQLEDLLKKGAVLAKNFYGGAFPETQGLEANDWVGLAERHLAEVFGPEFLTGLEQTDKTLRLKVEAPGLSDYARGLEKGIVPEEAAQVVLGGRVDDSARPRPQSPLIAGDRILGSRLAN